ncbi:MAG: hypothetical protein GQ574_07940 [Crocinitomix sp.]|nr:hypothetical protein [Crocinitomix sp.]
MKVNLIVLLVLGIALVSCDPAQTIEIENKADSKSSIKFFFNGDEYHKFEGFLTKDSLILDLDSSEKKIFHFGIGTWEMNNSLDSLIARVKKVEIETAKSTETFDTEARVKSFFWDRLID